MARLMKLWAFLDVPSGSIMSVWTGSVILMAWIAFGYTLWKGKVVDLPGGVVSSYAAALAAFAGTNILKKRETSSPLPVQAEETHGE